ncbi:arrestin domain-containing protein 3-like [Pholidichthys leucotaenia]
MSDNVTSFSVGYNPTNKENIFTSGDQITGQITLELSEECKIQSLFVKMKGKATVRWTEHYGKTIVTYYKKDKYFSIKQFLLQEGQGTSVIPKGSHVYPFTFQIPAQELPSSFRGKFGRIVYKFEAFLSRSMRMDNKAKAEFTIINKVIPDPMLKAPQQNIINKKMNLFTSGSVAMDVNIPQTGFHQGEGIKVVASIQNKSSRDIKPKFCLYRKCSFFAQGRRKVHTKDIVKEVGEAVPPSAGQTVTKIITIPPTETTSILNCKILKVEYRLRVYLDVKYASDPELKFPLIILPASEGSDDHKTSVYPSKEFEAFPYNMSGGASFQPNATFSGASDPPPSYGTHEMYPALENFDKKP